MTTASSSQRRCPDCGALTAAEHCPADGTQTLRQGQATRDALGYKPGEVLGGRYRIKQPIGRGGFGAVYSGEHTGTHQPVALKVLTLDPETAGDDVVRRFFKEAQVTAQLRAPNTVRLFDVGQDDAGPMYLAMELLDGPTLEQVLREAAKANSVMTEAQALDLAIPILRSLHEAHGKGLVHRDLKPANIMLATSDDDEPVVKVLDFGIARTQDSSLTGGGTALGTPSYMSPEQCQGKPLDGRSDLYALGVILWRCVVGTLPFSHASALTLMYAHSHEALPDLRKLARTPVSDGFVACVHGLLAKAADDRPADARTLRQTMEALRGGTWAGTPMPPMPTVTFDPGDAEATSAMSTPAPSRRPNAGSRPPSLAPPPTGAMGSATMLLDTGTRDAQPEAVPAEQRRRLGPAVAALVAVVGAGILALAMRSGPADPEKPLTPVLVPQASVVAAPLPVARPEPPTGPAPTPPAAPEPTLPAADPQRIKAEALGDLARQPGDLAARLKYAQEAVKLAPADAGLVALRAGLEVEKQAADAATRRRVPGKKPRADGDKGKSDVKPATLD